MSLVSLLKKKGIRVITAESCTCGRLPDALCVPGASSVLLGGYVTYTNERKVYDLGVRWSTLLEHTAVSARCAEEMALGALNGALKKRWSSTLANLPDDPEERCAGIIALSTTGFVGPYLEDLPTDDWHAYVGLRTSWGVSEVREVRFTVDARDPNRDLVVDEALQMLARAVEEFA